MTPEDVARYLDLETAVTSFFERVRARAEHLLMLGVPVPGYTRVPLRANWAWKDELMAPAALRGLGLSEQDIYETRLRSPAQVRNVLKSRAPRRKRGEPKPTDPLDGIVVNTTAGRYRIGKAKDGDTASSGLIGGIELPMVGAVHED
ncbi:MAG: DUF2800 domain-containing protein, partial [Burkholderiaceae bacterium]|nr:DUF2800 domain-containing protein [Burkholderiaceae bacterium]